MRCLGLFIIDSLTFSGLCNGVYCSIWSKIWYVRLGFPSYVMSCPFQAEKVSCSFPTIATLRSQPPKNPQGPQRVGHYTRIIPLVLLERSNKLTNETWKFGDKSRMFIPKVQVVRFHIRNSRLGHLAMWMPDPIAGRLLDVHLSLDRRCPDMRIPDICICSLLVSWWNPLWDRWLAA